MFASHDITPSSPVQVGIGSLPVATSGPAARFRISMAGSAPNGWSLSDRMYRVELNNTTVIDTILNQFDARINHNTNVPLSAISTNNNTIRISNRSNVTTDRIVSGFFELTYPRQFNFGNQANFAFTIPASASTKYLEFQVSIPDYTPRLVRPYKQSQIRYGSSRGIVRVVLHPSTTDVNLVLVSQDPSNIIL
jgi:hypothetical protein